VVYGKVCSRERTLKDLRLDYVLKAILDVILGTVLRHNNEGLSIGCSFRLLYLYISTPNLELEMSIFVICNIQLEETIPYPNIQNRV
jgi:hypothetical protein